MKARHFLIFILVLALAACGTQPQTAAEPEAAPETGTEPAARLPTATLAEAAPEAIDTPAGETPAAAATSEAIPDTSASETEEPASEPEGEPAEVSIQEYPVPAGSHPHDVAPAPDGSVWYTAQRTGELGRLDPQSGETRHIPLGAGSAPHGVIVGPDGAAWVTDSGLNAIVRVDGQSEEVQAFPLPEGSGYANLNTAAFDGDGVLWFTGQRGVYGRLDPANGVVEVFEAPGGPGPYGITSTPDGSIYYASLAGSHIARVDLQTGEASRLDPPTAGQGARRVWSDSQGRIWVSEWNVGQVGVYDPADDTWSEWKLPGEQPQAYAVYVDERDVVWLSDFGANALVSFDPRDESFSAYPLPSPNAQVRQILGRPGEVWGAESGTDKLVVIRTGSAAPVEGEAVSTESAGEAAEGGLARFVLLPQESEARYRVREQLANVSLPNDAVGSTQVISGTVTVDAQGTIVAGESRFVVDLSTLQSDRSQRDNFLRRNTLNTAQYPNAVFVPRRAEGLPAELPTSGEVAFTLVGDLTLREVTREVVWEVTGTLQEGELRGLATTSFTFDDFGLAQPRVSVVLSVEDTIKLEVEFVVRQET